MDSYWESKTLQVEKKVCFVSDLSVDQKVNAEGKLFVEAFDFKTFKELIEGTKKRLLAWLKQTYPEFVNSKVSKEATYEKGDEVVTLTLKIDRWNEYSKYNGNIEECYYEELVYTRKVGGKFEDSFDEQGCAIPSYLCVSKIDEDVEPNFINLMHYKEGQLSSMTTPSKMTIESKLSHTSYTWYLDGKMTNQGDSRKHYQVSQGFCTWNFGKVLLEEKIYTLPAGRNHERCQKHRRFVIL